MEKLRELVVKRLDNYKIGIPIQWLKDWLPRGGILELNQEQDRLILTPKKNSKEKAGCK